MSQESYSVFPERMYQDAERFRVLNKIRRRDILVSSPSHAMCCDERRSVDVGKLPQVESHHSLEPDFFKCTLASGGLCHALRSEQPICSPTTRGSHRWCVSIADYYPYGSDGNPDRHGNPNRHGDHHANPNPDNCWCYHPDANNCPRSAECRFLQHPASLATDCTCTGGDSACTPLSKHAATTLEGAAFPAG